MTTYRVDTNLPYFFSLWRTDACLFQRDFDPLVLDTNVWDQAKANNLTVITKDRDGSDRILPTTSSPRIIHLKTGNLNMRAFHQFIAVQWPTVATLSTSHKLVYVFIDRIECIE